MRARVAVLMGGPSAERAVSLRSGAACAEALRRCGYDVVEIDAGSDLPARLNAEKPDLAFNALHGPWGEDGRVQGLLEVMGVPYTHSGVLASALAMDKPRAKAVFAQSGLPIAPHIVASRRDVLERAPFAMPYVIKPIDQGSSVGVLIVREGDNHAASILQDPAWSFGEQVMAEAYAPGRELTVTLRDGVPLAVTEIRAKASFYDYDAKYAAGGSEHILPADMPADAYDAAMNAAAQAFRALGCRGLARADFRWDDRKGREGLVLLEVNTQPGMTETSLAPEQAAHLGEGFDDLVAWIAEDASCSR